MFISNSLWELWKLLWRWIGHFIWDLERSLHVMTIFLINEASLLKHKLFTMLHSGSYTPWHVKSQEKGHLSSQYSKTLPTEGHLRLLQALAQGPDRWLLRMMQIELVSKILSLCFWCTKDHESIKEWPQCLKSLLRFLCLCVGICENFTCFVTFNLH